MPRPRYTFHLIGNSHLDPVWQWDWREGLNEGLITARTRSFYAAYVDLGELAAEGDRMVGDDIAEDGIRYLQAINFKDAGRPVSIAAE